MEKPTTDDLAKALTLLAHALCAATDGRIVLQSLIANAAAIEQAGRSTPALEALVQPMLLAASSVALKQNPNDPGILGIYQDLRSKHRH